MKLLRGHKTILSKIEKDGFYTPKTELQKKLAKKLVDHDIIIDLTGSGNFVLKKKKL